MSSERARESIRGQVVETGLSERVIRRCYIFETRGYYIYIYIYIRQPPQAKVCCGVLLAKNVFSGLGLANRGASSHMEAIHLCLRHGDRINCV